MLHPAWRPLNHPSARSFRFPLFLAILIASGCWGISLRAADDASADDAAAENVSDEPSDDVDSDATENDDAGDDTGDDADDNAIDSGHRDFDLQTVTTHGQVQVEGEVIAYTANTGTLTQTDDAGNELAKMFFVAYTRDDVPADDRPVSFAFNGGPGSSSVWLHLGMLGPRRIKLPDDATPLRPPYRMQDNPFCLLSVTDLIFIDPVSTGFSRPEDDENKSDFHGFNEDVRSVSQFIHDWLSAAGRWRSPKFLIGESYGGIRAAGVAARLQDRYNLELNGAVVISGAINFKTLRFNDNNDTPLICFLPTYAATAWYHGALPSDLQSLPVREVVQQAEAFAFGDYADVLLRGDAAPDSRVDAVVTRYAELTGLSEDFIRRCDLRITQQRFSKELLRSDSRTVGRFDSRYRGIDRDNAGEGYDYDASGAAIFGPFTQSINHYLRQELDYRQPRTYEILTGNVQPWNYKNFTGRYVDASEDLRVVMTANPYFKLYLACGYYDLATPHHAMQYTMNHLGLDESRQRNVQYGFFEGGHMMYIHEPSMRQLYADLTQWYAEANGLNEASSAK